MSGLGTSQGERYRRNSPWLVPIPWWTEGDRGPVTLYLPFDTLTHGTEELFGPLEVLGGSDYVSGREVGNDRRLSTRVRGRKRGQVFGWGCRV